jgi:hypothetical protein
VMPVTAVAARLMVSTVVPSVFCGWWATRF